MEWDRETAKHRLLNEFQRDFPLEREPFAILAERIGIEEAQVLEWLSAWSEDGTVSRVGAVIRPGAIGASTLAAMRVPGERLEAVAAIVSAFPEVNHNYEREAELNLWFVATAASESELERVLREIERRAGCPVHDLRLEEEFRIDLGFDLGAEPGARQ